MNPRKTATAVPVSTPATRTVFLHTVYLVPMRAQRMLEQPNSATVLAISRGLLCMRNSRVYGMEAALIRPDQDQTDSPRLSVSPMKPVFLLYTNGYLLFRGMLQGSRIVSLSFHMSRVQISSVPDTSLGIHQHKLSAVRLSAVSLEGQLVLYCLDPPPSLKTRRCHDPT